MKNIGLIGGVTWTSTMDYYKLINQKSNKKLGKHNTAEVIIYSVNFEPVLEKMTDGEWNIIQQEFINKAIALKKSGADFFAIASNTLAKVGAAVSQKSGLPIVDMIKSVADFILLKNISRVGFLGTSFAMENGFYKKELKKFGIEAIIPDKNKRNEVNRIIMEELAFDILKSESREKIKNIITNLHEHRQVQGVILGCTEIPLLIKQKDVNIPVFDTTSIHVDAIIRRAEK